MVGWDFSRLDGRMFADEPDWDFEDMCVAALSNANSALDMGTGEGERLLALCERLGGRRPLRLAATEGWAPNLTVAREALSPLEIEVAEYDRETNEAMPFRAASFDLLMARHESYDAREAARVLRPDGLLLTQQVDGRDSEEQRRWFGGQATYPDVTLDHYVMAATAAGLVVEAQGEWTGHTYFADAQALVEYMGLVPWDVPGFTVAPHLATLSVLDASRPVVVSQRRFWLVARKSSSRRGEEDEPGKHVR